jgi:dephospho-CoA kinase
MLIGLTGTYCSGKNHISALLEARGIPVLDVDKLGYKALEMGKDAVFAQFGGDLRMADGSVNRRLLGQRVFGKPEKLAALEDIVHPATNRLANEWVADRGGSCVINAALLHKATLFKRLDRIILVTAPYFTRLIRAKRRDKLPWAEIFKRFKSQKDFYSQYLSINAEIYIVENPGLIGVWNPREKLERRLDKCLEGIK